MKDKGNIISSQQSGFFQDLILRIKLILRLMGDRRVNFLLKILPIGAVIYLISPVDLISGVVLPFIGALDDAAILWLGTSLFVSLCPDEVVQEHWNALQKVIPAAWRDVEEKESPEIIEVEPRDGAGDEESK